MNYLIESHEISSDIKLKGVDGIRGLACLIVLINHAKHIFYSHIPPYAGSARIGV